MQSTKVLAAALLCATVQGTSLIPTPPAFDPKGYYHVRQDYRRCMAPLCGGYWLRKVNRRRMRCADGKKAEECYVADIVADSDFAFKGPTQLLKGHHCTKEWDNFGELGTFTLEVAHSQASETEGTGAFVAVKDNGIRCITHPCPSMTEIFLNRKRSRNIADLQFSEELDAEMVSWARNKIMSGEEVVVSGRHNRVTGPAGKALGLKVNQIYKEITCPAGYSWHKEACRTPFGCAHPEIEHTAAGGAPRVDGLDGVVTGTHIQSCVKSCDPPSFLNEPGQCYLALP